MRRLSQRPSRSKCLPFGAHRRWWERGGRLRSLGSNPRGPEVLRESVVHRGFLPAGSDELKPEQQHPLPSYLEYRRNASVRVYQTDYFASKCAESPDSNSKSFHIKLGAEMESLGGKCDPHQQKFCDGPLKPRTAYRLDV